MRVASVLFDREMAMTRTNGQLRALMQCLDFSEQAYGLLAEVAEVAESNFDGGKPGSESQVLLKALEISS